MKIVSTSYSSTPEFTDPKQWLERISFYTGILDELSKQHEVISIERINYEGSYQQNGAEYRFIKQKRKIDRFPRQAHHFIKKLKPDIVLVNGFIFPLQIIQLRMTLGRATKIIVLHRAEKPFKGLKKYLQRIADRCVDAYFFSSAELGKEWIEKGIIKNKQKIHEVMQASSIFSPTDKAIARSKLSVLGLPVFLWVGRLEANKDPLTVLKGFIQFLNHQPASVLYMIYQSEELIDEVKKITGKSENIKLIGNVSHKELQNWYNSADFIISGSHYEGSGIAVCEAMSCGCIPVVTNIDSFRSITGRGKCGLLYEPGNVDDLLAALLKTNQIDIEKERINVLQQFKEELSFEAIKKKIETKFL